MKVLEEGLEPTHLSVPDPKSGASANFAIRATLLNCHFKSENLTLCDRMCDFYGMQCNAPKRGSKADKAKVSIHEGSKFLAVIDSRKRKVRGLVQRNGKFYAQMRVTVPSGKSRAFRIPLVATRLDEAIKEAEKKRTEKHSGEIHLPGKRPQFSKLVEEYKESADFKGKKEGTRQNETQSLNRWIEHLGGTRIDWIEEKALTSFCDNRAADGVTNRTINLDMTAFNNAMKYAKGRGWLKTPVRVKKLYEPPAPTHKPITKAQIDSILEHAGTASKNFKLLRFYIRFLFSSGCREQEAVKIRKADVDMVRGVVHVGADGDTKNRQGREVQFNASLRQVLTEILDSLPDDTQWLFPSPQRGRKDIHAKSLRESFYASRDAAGLEGIGFHHLRHYFASTCVMAGIDYMTIAKWLGHQDGGMLVAKVYGHLNDEHQRKAAEKLNF
jgi:integrase